MEQTCPGSASDPVRLFHGRRAGPGHRRSRRLRLWGTCMEQTCPGSASDLVRVFHGRRAGPGQSLQPGSARGNPSQEKDRSRRLRLWGTCMEQTCPGSASDLVRVFHGRRAGPGHRRSRRLRLWGTPSRRPRPDTGFGAGRDPLGIRGREESRPDGHAGPWVEVSLQVPGR